MKALVLGSRLAHLGQYMTTDRGGEVAIILNKENQKDTPLCFAYQKDKDKERLFGLAAEK